MDPGYGGPRSLAGPDLFRSALSRKIFIGATLYRTAAVRRVWSAVEEMGEIADYALNVGLARLSGVTGVYLGGNDFLMSEHPGQVSVTQLAPIFPLAERFHQRLLRDAGLLPYEIQEVRHELRSWYREWGKHEAWTAGRPARALTHVCRALRLDPLSLPSWRLAVRLGWDVVMNGVRRPHNRNSA
jgi:hypothetical protein